MKKMPDDASGPRRHTRAAIETWMAGVFRATGMPDGDSKLVAQLMAEADLFGGDGHGIIRIPNYVKRLQGGGYNPRPNIRIVRERGGMAIVDGDDGMGHLVMHFATQEAIRRAKEHGIAWVGSRNSNHAGAAHVYARMPMAHDMIGLYAAVGSANHFPPWGGTELLLSTNPIAIALPTDKEPPVVLDMATTVSSMGKIKQAEIRGEKLPEGWVIDRDGNPITDPKEAHHGFLLPIGGPKGYGLCFALGALAGTLNGAAFGRNVVDFNADATSKTNTGQFICALSIDAFMDVMEYRREMDDLVRQMKSSPKLNGVDEIRLPGERSWHTHIERQKTGIPVPPALQRQLDDVADRLGVGRLG